MQPSSAPGAEPLVSERLTNWLQTDSDEAPVVQHDEFDQLIAAEGLSIARFTFFRDIDILIFVLSNRRLISRRFSTYSFFEDATDQQLATYTVSATGIHWPLIDVDLSLRGLLMEEAVAAARTGGTTSVAD